MLYEVITEMGHITFAAAERADKSGLDQVIQPNASAAEEMASTSEELSAQAAQRLSTIGFFRLHGPGSVAGVPLSSWRWKPMSPASGAARQLKLV